MKANRAARAPRPFSPPSPALSRLQRLAYQMATSSPDRQRAKAREFFATAKRLLEKDDECLP